MVARRYRFVDSDLSRQKLLTYDDGVSSLFPVILLVLSALGFEFEIALENLLDLASTPSILGSVSAIGNRPVEMSYSVPKLDKLKARMLEYNYILVR